MAKATQKQFLQQFFANTRFKIVNTVGMLKLANGLVIKCELQDYNERGRYTCVLVSVINAERGKTIDAQDFHFNNYFELTPESRKDHAGYFCVIAHTGWDWYISQPTDASIAKMFNEINELIAFYE